VIGAASSQAAMAWAQLDFTHALVAAPGGGLQLAFADTHSAAAGDPLDGLFTTLRNADGTRIKSGALPGPTGIL
jgi:hypothetical protein